VSESQLLQAVELAIWAPNGSNRQSWRFYIIMNKELISSVAETIQSITVKIRSWGQSSPGEKPVPPVSGAPRGGPRADPLRSAPALIVVASQKYENPRIVEIQERNKTDTEAREAQAMIDGLRIVNPRIQSVAAAIAYLSLALHQMGLGSVWLTGPLQAKSAIEKLLKIPEDLDIVALIPVGCPAETPVKDRKPVSEVCQIIR